MYILQPYTGLCLRNEFQVVAESLDAVLPTLVVDIATFRFGRARSVAIRGEHRVVRSLWMKASARWLESL